MKRLKYIPSFLAKLPNIAPANLIFCQRSNHLVPLIQNKPTYVPPNVELVARLSALKQICIVQSTPYQFFFFLQIINSGGWGWSSNPISNYANVDIWYGCSGITASKQKFPKRELYWVQDASNSYKKCTITNQQKILSPN